MDVEVGGGCQEFDLGDSDDLDDLKDFGDQVHIDYADEILAAQKAYARKLQLQMEAEYYENMQDHYDYHQ